MLAVRRDPSRLIAALASARRILIVCHGNIIRSPFAAALVAHALGPTRPHLAIASAGLDAVPGRPAHSHAVTAAEACEIDLRAHAATPLTREQVAASDVIFVMELLQLAAIGRRFPQARGKTFLLSCLAPEEPLEVRDPVEGDAPVFHACYDHISTAVRPIVRALAAVQPS
jgi:protein-tyrosine phosphatase